ncbi:MAG: HD domain-containing protein [Deltaproteobacteria bacterium]|nr:MAG: HD domain-containing protein [Deltaproteobacteria bacterium]
MNQREIESSAELLQREVLGLVRIGVALSDTRDLEELLQLIVSEAREFTSADAASIYLIEDGRLVFKVAQNRTLLERLGAERLSELFSHHSLPLDTSSIAGFVATTKNNVNIADVYHLPDGVPFSFNPDFDRRNDYRTKSVLAVPMIDREGSVQGVLQLINAMAGDRVVPFPKEREELVRALASQAAVAVNNARLTAELKRIHLDTIYRLAMAAEYKDKDTANHIRRMSMYSAILAGELGWNKQQQELMLYAAPMHDIGKIGIPDAILTKPGKLTEEEFRTIQSHTEIGARILSGSDADLLQLSELVALCHHEKWNGTGYPRGLKGKDIPQAGRIVAVADVFDALSSDRCYRRAMSLEQTYDIIRGDSGTHFDPECVEALARVLDRFHEIHGQYRDEATE